MIVDSKRETTVGIRKKHDRGFEPLRFVKIHQPDDIGSTWLERKRLHLVRFLGVFLERLGGICKTATLLDDLSNTIDSVQEVASFNAARCSRRQREIACVFQDAFQRCAGREYAGPPMYCRRLVNAAPTIPPEFGADCAGLGSA